MLMSLAAGWVLRACEPGLVGLAPVLRRDRGSATAGHAVWPAICGGLRPLVASGCWLRANLAWERRDETATIAWLDLTVATDERPAYFWLNGSRMLAYDMPAWKVDAGSRRDEDFTRRALDFLEKGLHWRGADSALLIEMGNLHLRRRGDLESAARYYGRAAEMPGAPYYAARIHAELLLALGRPVEALMWLRQVLPGLPPDEPAARRLVVESRIRVLEEMTGR